MSHWLERARQRAAMPPRRHRAPLYFAAHERLIAVGSLEGAIAARLVDAGLLHRAGEGYALALRSDLDTRVDADAALSAVARWLHEQGLASRWRDELLAVESADGRTLAHVERAVVRVLGIGTRAVHLIGCDADGKVWVQQRAFDKAVDPGLWDTLMGGQVAAGESVGQTLERETLEEAGLHVGQLLDLTPCDPITVARPVAEGYMLERIDVFRAVVATGNSPANLDGEVEQFACLDPAALSVRLEQGEFTLEATLILGAELDRRIRRTATRRS